jgi:glycosyltransferase involved in cell wall biosynthesis
MLPADKEAVEQNERIHFGEPAASHPAFHFIVNGMFGGLGGGDLHFLEMAKTLVAADYRLHFFGGYRLREVLAEQIPAWDLTLTEKKEPPRPGDSTLPDQLRLLRTFYSRYKATLPCLGEISENEPVYAVSDYWFDVLPLIRCRSRKKFLVLLMDAPTFGEILFRRRPDVPATRLNSIYYWLSQNISLRLFRRCPSKRLFYVHPNMKPRLLAMGYREEELVYVSGGCNLDVADLVPAQLKKFDVIWLGRIHKQKGIDDLLAALAHLRREIPDFRAVLVGNIEAALKPRLAEMGILDCVQFTGLVSEEEKFRLFKSSRVFLMPSHYESWGAVIAEALASGVPVVAYDVPAYRPVFGSLVRYVPCFDLAALKEQAVALVREARKTPDILPGHAIAHFKSENSLTAAGRRFLAGVKSLDAVA